jgi:hypothetical protein
MDQVVWLITGNKGGVGKSVIAKSLAEWLLHKQALVNIVDGDQKTPDVASTFHSIQTIIFDLHDDEAWQCYTDYLCQNKFGHVVTNLPDSLNKRTLSFFERFSKLAQSYGYQIKIIFVINTLPDGLYLLGTLQKTFNEIIPIKNLFFGKSDQFSAFDDAYPQYDEKTLLFPSLNPKIMQVARLSNMPFYDLIKQKQNTQSNTTYAKITLANWYENMIEVFNDAFEGE